MITSEELQTGKNYKIFKLRPAEMTNLVKNIIYGQGFHLFHEQN